MEKNISIHQGLSYLKLTDAKLNKLASQAMVMANKHSNEKIEGKSISDVNDELKANLQAYHDLCANRSEIKRKIALSNATTTITINGKIMTVVEAIEEKHFAKNRRVHIMTMRRNYNNALAIVENKNSSVEALADKFVADITGGKDKTADPETIKKLREDYVTAQSYDLLDPSKLADVLKKMEDELAEFENTIDFRLSESNATTLIEVDLKGDID